MKTERNILIAFLLNLFFSIFEFVGGIFTGSVAILSDSVHDFGDAFSIGVSFFLEKKSKKQPDEKYNGKKLAFMDKAKFLVYPRLLPFYGVWTNSARSNHKRTILYVFTGGIFSLYDFCGRKIRWEALFGEFRNKTFWGTME